jgi:hypothetical protein
MAKQKLDHATLYCGTSERIAKRAPVAGVNPEHEPAYLSDVYPGLLAFFATTNENDRFGILEIDLKVLDSSNFLPCEWFLDQTARQKAKSDREHHKRLDAFRKTLAKHKAKWKESLQRLGIIVYDAFVPRKAIRKITIYDPTSNPAITNSIVNARISLADYKKQHDRYRAMTRWLMGESVSVEEWLGPDLLETPKEEKEQLAENLQNKSGLDIFFYEAPPKGA